MPTQPILSETPCLIWKEDDVNHQTRTSKVLSQMLNCIIVFRYMIGLYYYYYYSIYYCLSHIWNLKEQRYFKMYLQKCFNEAAIMNVLLIKKRGQPTLKHVIYTYEHGFSYAWLAQEVGNIKTFFISPENKT